MKKLFTLVAMALMAVGANAQKVIAEIDWSTQEAFNNWCSGENGSTAVVGAEGLEINVPAAGDNYWNPQTVVLNIEGEKVADNPDAPAILAEDGQYQVVIVAKHPAGHLQVNLGTWDDGVSLQKDFDVAEATDFEDIEVDFSEGWPADCFSNIHVLWQSGALPGLSVLKKIQVIDLNGGEGGEEGGEGEGGEGGSAIVGEYEPEFLRMINGRAVITPLNTGRFPGGRREIVTPRNPTPQNITVVLELDGRDFARTTFPYIEQEQQRIGTKLVKGGAY
jgi:hypothetical protein